MVWMDQIKEDKEEVEPDWDTIVEEVKRTKFFPVDRFLLENEQLIFPSSKSVKLMKDKKVSGGRRIVIYRTERQSKRVDIIFVLPMEATLPSFNRYMKHVFFSMIPFALAEGTLAPFVRKEHQNKLLGNKSFYKHEINNILKTLTLGYWVYTTNKKGKEEIRKINHILDHVELYGKGRGSYYRAYINPQIVQSLCAIIEDKEKIPPYVRYPLQELASPPTRRSRIRQHFLKYLGLHSVYPLQVKTFLSKMGVTKREMKNKSLRYLLATADEGLAEVKKLGFDWGIDEASYPFKGYLALKTIKQKGLISLLELNKWVSNLKRENREYCNKMPYSLINKKGFLKLNLIFKEEAPKNSAFQDEK